MFTGIVEEIGEVRVNLKLSGKQRLDIAASAVLSGLKLGDSISVNGACLTVTAAKRFVPHVSKTSMDRNGLR